MSKHTVTLFSSVLTDSQLIRACFLFPYIKGLQRILSAAAYLPQKPLALLSFTSNKTMWIHYLWWNTHLLYVWHKQICICRSFILLHWSLFSSFVVCKLWWYWCTLVLSLCLCRYLMSFNRVCLAACLCTLTWLFVGMQSAACTCQREKKKCVHRYTISIGPCSFSLWSGKWDWTRGAGNWGALICPLRRLPGLVKSLTSLAQTQEATTEYLWEVN